MVSKGNHPKMGELFRLVKYDNLPRFILWVWGSPSRLLNGFLFLNVSKQNALSSCHFDLFVLFRFWGLNRITNLDNLGWWWIFRHMQFYIFFFGHSPYLSISLIVCHDWHQSKPIGHVPGVYLCHVARGWHHLLNLQIPSDISVQLGKPNNYNQESPILTPW